MGVRVDVVALQAVAVGRADQPAVALQPPVAVGQVDAAVGGPVLAAGDVALGPGEVWPALGGVPGDAGVGVRVDVVALQALTIVAAHVPARRQQPTVVVGKVDVARGRVPVTPAHDVALGAGIRPPARLTRTDESAGDQPSVRAQPIALHADLGALGVGVADEPSGARRAVDIVAIGAILLHPAALGRCGQGSRVSGCGFVIGRLGLGSCRIRSRSRVGGCHRPFVWRRRRLGRLGLVGSRPWLGRPVLGLRRVGRIRLVLVEGQIRIGVLDSRVARIIQRQHHLRRGIRDHLVRQGRGWRRHPRQTPHDKANHQRIPSPVRLHGAPPVACASDVSPGRTPSPHR